MVAAAVVPYLRTPTTPTACNPLLVTMAPANAGKSCFPRIGSSSDRRSSAEGAACKEEPVATAQRTSSEILRAFIVFRKFISRRGDYLFRYIGRDGRLLIARRGGPIAIASFTPTPRPV